MNYLLDTHLLLWTAARSPKLPARAAELIAAKENALWMSAVSLWEVAIKRSLDRSDFRYQVGQLRAGFLANGYSELQMEGRHTLFVSSLPPIHSDPFDRLLIAQAIAEGMTFLTADSTVARYGHPVQFTG